MSYKKGIGHTSAPKGKKVMLFFHSGRKLITKFIRKKGRFMETEDGKFSTDEVYKLSIYKNIK